MDNFYEVKFYAEFKKFITVEGIDWELGFKKKVQRNCCFPLLFFYFFFL